MLLFGACSMAGVDLEAFFFLVSCLSIWFEESSDILIIITIAANRSSQLITALKLNGRIKTLRRYD